MIIMNKVRYSSFMVVVAKGYRLYLPILICHSASIIEYLIPAKGTGDCTVALGAWH